LPSRLPVHVSRSVHSRHALRGNRTEIAGWPSVLVGFHGGLVMLFGQVTVWVSQSMAKSALVKPGCRAAWGSARTGPISAMPNCSALR
jgi:hypothetical protein